MTAMILDALAVGPLVTNCYLVGCAASRAGLVVDPGGDADKILRRLRKLRLDVQWIVDTHGHGDHIEAQRCVKEAYPAAKIAVHEADASALTDATVNLSGLFGLPITSPPAERLLRHGDEIAVRSLRFHVLHVPGHTPGGIALYVPPVDGDPLTPAVFCGDALFAGSIGRSDFPGGDMDVLLRAIRQYLLTLPPETRVYPGHGDPTTIGQEARSNPFLT